MSKITRRITLGLLGLAIATSGCSLVPKKPNLRNYQPLTEKTLQLTSKQEQELHQAMQKGRKFKKGQGLEAHYYDFKTGERTELFRTPQETESALYVDCDDLAIWMASQIDQLEIPNQVIIGRLSPKYPQYHAWNELYLDGIQIIDLATRTRIIRKTQLPSDQYQGLFSFQGPYTEEKLEQLQREWNIRKQELRK